MRLTVLACARLSSVWWKPIRRGIDWHQRQPSTFHQATCFCHALALFLPHFLLFSLFLLLHTHTQYYGHSHSHTYNHTLVIYSQPLDSKHMLMHTVHTHSSNLASFLNKHTNAQGDQCILKHRYTAHPHTTKPRAEELGVNWRERQTHKEGERERCHDDIHTKWKWMQSFLHHGSENKTLLRALTDYMLLFILG